ncbi:Cell cycle checkpoint protein RAD1-like [Leishmania donovani]|uniref:Cell_cycle_checkpoint_protein_RAD1-like_putative/ GeneDB:LmjF.20.0390 n=1 Tax=Leishmania donovani TaxID=5661 RepID=A0A6J8F938_LEIDO|nr:Cell cycle checkpoint protein RAD1-like [Leishmania donovani]VDZ44219.1 Cell_cycle_checkpoint_protein_RAD1-like_putative/GeneDB:LmjF.20.0390 [Leishmania donovani]
MSIYCRLASPPVFLRALHTVSVSRDGWATVVFTDSHVVLHVEGTDENMTATCTLPKNLFAEYAVVETRFALHIPTLIDALLMLGPSVATASTRAVLAYPTDDAKLLVELTPTDRVAGGGSCGGFSGGGPLTQSDLGVGGSRMLQSLLVTRNVRDHLLDLRFSESALLAQVTLQGDTVRDLIADVTAAQCAEVSIRIDPKLGVILRGEGGPYGEVEAHVHATSEALLSLSREQFASTRVYTHHLALACGARGGTGGGGSSGGSAGAGGTGGGRLRGTGASVRDGRLSNADYILMGLAASAAGAGSSGGGGGAAVGTLFGGFERLTLQINAQRQLSVLHTQRDHELKVFVTVVVMPLSSVYDML